MTNPNSLDISIGMWLSDTNLKRLIAVVAILGILYLTTGGIAQAHDEEGWSDSKNPKYLETDSMEECIAFMERLRIKDAETHLADVTEDGRNVSYYNAELDGAERGRWRNTCIEDGRLQFQLQTKERY